MAPAIALAGAMVGFTFPLLVASYTHSNIIGFLADTVCIGCPTHVAVGRCPVS